MTDRIKWGPGRRARFQDFMQHDIRRALGARSGAEANWKTWLEQYRAPISKATSYFPFVGASARTYPVMAENMDPILANFMANIHAPENLWTLSPLNERWIQTAKPLQDFLTILDHRQLKMWDVNMRVFTEGLKLGTSIWKTSWLFNQRRTMGYDSEGRRAPTIVTVNRPVVDHVPLLDFLIPPEALAIDPNAQGGAMWVAQRHRLRPAQLRQMAEGAEPVLPNFDKDAVKRVIDQYESGNTDRIEKIQELDTIGAATSGQPENYQIEIWEIHARFDTTGNGIEDDIIVFYHERTGLILRALYQQMPDRPYSAFRYVRGDGFYGIGVGEQTEMWQNTISDILNYDIDKILLSNMPMWAASDQANIGANEPMFPGKILFTPNPKDDIVALQSLSNGNFDIMSLLGFLQTGVRGRVGVNDIQRANVGALPSRTPATTVQSMLQEGNTRFDMSMKDQRMGGLSDVGLHLLQHLQMQTQNFTNNPFAGMYAEAAMSILGQPEGQAVAQALMAPNEAIEDGLGVSLTATSGTNNRELQKQSKLALLQILTQAGGGLIQLAQLYQQDPQGPVGQTAAHLFQGGTELLRQTFDDFDVRNTEELVPNATVLMGAAQNMAAGVPIGAPMPGMEDMNGFV